MLDLGNKAGQWAARGPPEALTPRRHGEDLAGGSGLADAGRREWSGAGGWQFRCAPSRGQGAQSPHLPDSQAGLGKQGPKGLAGLPVASSGLAPNPGLPTLQAQFLCCDWNFHLWARALSFYKNVRKERGQNAAKGPVSRERPHAGPPKQSRF